MEGKDAVPGDFYYVHITFYVHIIDFLLHDRLLGNQQFDLAIWIMSFTLTETISYYSQ